MSARRPPRAGASARKAAPRPRCAWADGDPLLAAYHDTEWGVPVRHGRALFELLMLEAFQAGLSWLVVLRKREALRAAFHGFDPAKVARMGPRDVARLLRDPGIIRSRAKIEATIGGARAYLAMEAAGEPLPALVRGLAGGKPIRGRPPVPAQTPLSVALSKALKARGFRFVGPTIVYAFLQAAGVVDDHAPGCFRRRGAARRRC